MGFGVPVFDMTTSAVPTSEFKLPLSWQTKDRCISDHAISLIPIKLHASSKGCPTSWQQLSRYKLRRVFSIATNPTTVRYPVQIQNALSEAYSTLMRKECCYSHCITLYFPGGLFTILPAQPAYARISMRYRSWPVTSQISAGSSFF